MTPVSDRLEGVGVAVYIDTATASNVLGRGCEELARNTRLAPDTGRAVRGGEAPAGFRQRRHPSPRCFCSVFKIDVILGLGYDNFIMLG